VCGNCYPREFLTAAEGALQRFLLPVLAVFLALAAIHGSVASAQNAQLAGAAISPDGRYIAVISPHSDILSIQPLGEMQDETRSVQLSDLDIPRRFRTARGHGAPRAIERERTYLELVWLGDQRLLLSIGSLARIIRTGETNDFTRLFVIELDDFSLTALSPGSRLLSIAPEDPNRIVVEEYTVSRNQFGQGELSGMTSSNIDEYDSFSDIEHIWLGDQRQPINWGAEPRLGHHLGFDRSGMATISVLYWTGGWVYQFWWRAPAGEWLLIENMTRRHRSGDSLDDSEASRRHNIVSGINAGVDSMGTSATLAVETDDEQIEIRRLALPSGMISDVLASGEATSFDGFLLDWRDGSVVGMKWSPQSGGTQYWHEGFQAIQTLAEAHFNTRSVWLSSWDIELTRIVVDVEQSDGTHAFYLFNRALGQFTEITG
jgi:hypothetical protein